MDRVPSFRYQRVVARDNTVRLDGRLIQVPPGPKRRSYTGARVWVHELLDGGLGVWYQDQWLVRSKGSQGSQAAVVRARKRKPERKGPPEPVVAMPLPLPAPVKEKGSAAHPWRRWSPGYLAANPRARTESLSS